MSIEVFKRFGVSDKVVEVVVLLVLLCIFVIVNFGENVFI